MKSSLMTSVSSLVLRFVVRHVSHLHIAIRVAKGCLYLCISKHGVWQCWTSNRPAWSKIEGRLQISKCWNLLIRTARWVVSQTRVLQRSNTRAIFHNIFIDIVSTCVSSSRWPPEPSNAPPTFFSLCSLCVLGMECSHSVYFFVLASSNCPSVVFLCSQGYLHTHHSTMYQKTHQLQLIALYSQQAL